MIFNSLNFWTLVIGLIYFVAKFFFPAFPLNPDQMLALLLAALGGIGIYPRVKAAIRGIAPVTINDLIRNKEFWFLLTGVIYFIVKFYVPAFPLTDVVLLAVVLFVLSLFGINPELRARGFLVAITKPRPVNVKGKQPK